MKGCFTQVIVALFLIGGIAIMYDSFSGEEAQKLAQLEKLEKDYKVAFAMYDTIVNKNTQELNGIDVTSTYSIKYFFFTEDTQFFSGIHKGLKTIPDDYFVYIRYAPLNPAINSADIDLDKSLLDDDTGFGLMFWMGLLITIIFGVTLLISLFPDKHKEDKVNF